LFAPGKAKILIVDYIENMLDEMPPKFDREVANTNDA
jgi:hypothetical protein